MTRHVGLEYTRGGRAFGAGARMPKRRGWFRSRRVAAMNLRLVVFAACILCGTAPSAADRAAVEATMRRMASAVLAGDVEGYLVNISTGDGLFLKEQVNWAKDLKLHVPTTFALTIYEPAGADEQSTTEDAKSEEDGTAAAASFDDAAGVARFEMVTQWTMKPQEAEGKDRARTVSFPVAGSRTTCSPLPAKSVMT